MIKNALPRRQRRDWHRRRRIEVNVLRLTHKLARRRRDIFSITAGVRPEITIDVIAGYKIFDACPARTASPVRQSDGLVPGRVRTWTADGVHRSCDLAA